MREVQQFAQASITQQRTWHGPHFCSGMGSPFSRNNCSRPCRHQQTGRGGMALSGTVSLLPAPRRRVPGRRCALHSGAAALHIAAFH